MIQEYIHILSHSLALCGLSHAIEYSSLCYIVGVCCLSVLYNIFLWVIIQSKWFWNSQGGNNHQDDVSVKTVALMSLTEKKKIVFWWKKLIYHILLHDLVVPESLSHVWLFCLPMDCSIPGSSVHGTLQTRILQWVAISFSRGFPDPVIEPRSLALLVDSLPRSHQGSPFCSTHLSYWNKDE